MTQQSLGARGLRELLDRHGVRPAKALGQNFVIDPNTVRKVARIAGVSREDRVLEIGAGAGSLTLPLAEVAGTVVAVEVDRRLVPALRESLAGVGNVEIVHADALALDLGSIAATHLVGNLPYNIATPVVVRALEEAPHISSLTVMTQKEVGERLVAGPGNKAYGQVSVVVGYFARATVAMRVSRNAFYPVPGVDSVVVRLERHARHVEVEPAWLFEVVRAAFSQRRKTLRNALAPLAGSARAAELALEASGVAPGARAEEIGLEGFAAVANRLGP